MIKYWFLIFIISSFFLLVHRDKVFSPPFFYILGSAFFLFPGALTGRNQLWTWSVDAEIRAYVAALLSMSFFVLGYYFSGGDGMLAKCRERSPDKVWLGRHGALALMLSLLIIKLYFDPDNFLSKMFTNVGRLGDSWVFAKYLNAVVYVPNAAAAIAGWALFTTKSRQVRLLMLGILLIGFISLSRTPVFYIIGGLLIYKFAFLSSVMNNRFVRLLMIGFLVLMAPVAISVAAFYKGLNPLVDGFNVEGILNYRNVAEFVVEWGPIGAVSDAFGNLKFILEHFPSQFAYMYGISPISILLAGIPRDFIPWKPFSPSYYLTNHILGDRTFEMTGTSLAPSFVGELWMNGGWTAVVLGSLLLGYVLRLMVKYLKENAGPGVVQVCYAMTLIMCFLIPRGDLLSTFFRGLVNIAITYFMAKLFWPKKESA